MSDDVEAIRIQSVVIGGGIIGLSIARALALCGLSVALLEKENQLVQGISARNSGVIHAGLYYPKDWLKTRLCVEGSRKLYQYLQAHQLPHKKLGKLVVAKEVQRASLLSLLDQAKANGVEGLRLVEKSELKLLEPDVDADLAIYSANTGIVDVLSLARQLELDISELEGLVLPAHEVLQISQSSKEGFVLSVSGPDGEFQLESNICINAAGFAAPSLANGLYEGSFERLNKGLINEAAPDQYFAQGHYYSYQASAPFSHLIYPMPEPEQQGLGVHSTFDMNGQIQFGPDVRYIPKPDYAFDDSQRQDFIEAIKCYYPNLDESKLVPGQVGVRPKLSKAGEPAQDFKIQSEVDHGMTGLVNLFGIESPGLTSSFAIADYVLTLLGLRTVQ